MTLSSLYKIKTLLEEEIDDIIKDLSIFDNKITKYYLNDCIQSLFEVYDEILLQDNSDVTNDCLSNLKKEYLVKLATINNKNN